MQRAVSAKDAESGAFDRNQRNIKLHEESQELKVKALIRVASLNERGNGNSSNKGEAQQR